MARDAENEGGNQGEKVSSAQGTQGTNIAVKVGQFFDKCLPLSSAAWGVAEDVAPTVARALGKDISNGCGKVLSTLGPAAGRAMIGGASIGVTAAVELIGYGVNRALIARSAKKGKITEAEKDLLINVQDRDVQYAATQVVVTCGCIAIAFIPVAGLPLAGIYGTAVGVIGQIIRNRKKEEALKNAIWDSNKNE